MFSSIKDIKVKLDHPVGRQRTHCQTAPDPRCPTTERACVQEREVVVADKGRQASFPARHRGLLAATPASISLPIFFAASPSRFLFYTFRRQVHTSGKKLASIPPGVALCVTCTGCFSMTLPTRGRVIINTTAGELDIELWSRVRSLSRHSVPLLRSENECRNVRRHAETSSPSPWRVSFRFTPLLFPVPDVHSPSLRLL